MPYRRAQSNARTRAMRRHASDPIGRNIPHHHLKRYLAVAEAIETAGKVAWYLTKGATALTAAKVANHLYDRGINATIQDMTSPKAEKHIMEYFQSTPGQDPLTGHAFRKVRRPRKKTYYK